MASTDTLEIRQLARQFAESELRPHVEKWDHDGALAPAALAHLAELGFFGMLVPEAHGGMEFDLPTYVSALEEIAWGEPATALTLAITSFVAQQINASGTDQQKHAWLEKIAGGDVVACFALAEEEAGADATALVTRATRTGDGWTIKGVKQWVTNGRLAKLALVIANTDDGPRAFLVPTNSPGYRVTHREQTLGLRPIDIATVEFDNVQVDAQSVLTVPSAEQLGASDVGALAVAAISVGICQSALDHAIRYADVREQFQAKLRAFEGIQFKLADMAMRTEAARALLEKAAADPTPALCAMSKVFASEAAMWVTTNAVQIFGGYGYMRDYPVEKLMRDAKAMEILEGSNEIQRVKIARELYK